MVERMRRARSDGVTLWDVGASDNPPAAERLLALAFPSLDTALTVVVRRTMENLVRFGSEGTVGLRAEDEVSSRLATSLRESNRRLAPQSVTVVEWGDGPLPPAELRDRVVTDLGRAPPLSWCRQLDPSPTVPASNDVPADLYSGQLSLLDTRWAVRPDRPLGPFLARNVWADGLLDGSRLDANPAERGPGAGPVRFRDIESAYAPVLRLERLTHDRRRTLRQSALRFATYWPWVASAIVPLPPVDRWEETREAWTRPGLTPAEVEWVLAARPPPAPESGRAGPALK